MTNIQTNEIASDVKVLSDDELNEVAGGFSWAFLSSPAFQGYVAAIRIAQLFHGQKWV